MPYKTFAEIKTAVASVLETEVPKLPGRWDDLVAAGMDMATEHLRRVYINKNYTEAQILAWTGCAPWHRVACMYYILSEANLDDDRALQQLDRYRDLLKSLDEMGGFRDANQIPLDPTGPRPTVGFGFEDTSNDRFTREMTL